MISNWRRLRRLLAAKYFIAFLLRVFMVDPRVLGHATQVAVPKLNGFLHPKPERPKIHRVPTSIFHMASLVGAEGKVVQVPLVVVNDINETDTGITIMF